MRYKNFTLIELLIVIAIIAILAGMLLPALNQAREKGISASCVGRLKSIAQADTLYQADYEYFSPARERLMGGSGKFWCGLSLGNASNGGDKIDFTADGFLTPYLKKTGDANQDIMNELSSNVFVCPHASVAGMLAGQKVTSANGGGYAANRNVHGYFSMFSPGSPMAEYEQGGAMVRPGILRNPSSVVGFGDSAVSTDSGLRVNNLLSCNKIHFRHRGQGNFAFCDGHVSFRSGFYTHSGEYLADPINHVGCLDADEEDLNTEKSLYGISGISSSSRH